MTMSIDQLGSAASCGAGGLTETAIRDRVAGFIDRHRPFGRPTRGTR